jgi:hypothetical protein
MFGISTPELIPVLFDFNSENWKGMSSTQRERHEGAALGAGSVVTPGSVAAGTE